MSTIQHGFQPIDHFDVHGDELLVGGVSLRELKNRAGQTPFFAYDRAMLNRRVSQLRELFPAGISLHYAMKANPMPAVVQHMATLVDGLDVASVKELRVALDTGTSPHDISFAGPGKRLVELEAAIETGVCINVESETEMQRCVELSAKLGKAARVAVRVNPDFELKTSGMKMGGRPTAFGVDAERVPAMLKVMGREGLDFQGFHIYNGSQNLKPDSLIDAQNQTVELGIRLSEHAPSPVKMFNIGGGFGIPYFPGDQALDLQPVADNLQRLLPHVKQHLPEAEIIIELGRYFVGEAGIYVAEVVDRKVSRGEVFLITDGGLHHHLAATGNFGQFIRKNYPVAVGNRMTQPATETVNVVGPLCTPLDLLGSKVQLPRADVGDLIVVFLSGAYGATASPGGFLSHPEVVEMLV